MYAKVGRGTVPEDIRVLLRLHSLPTERGPVDVHIAHQKSPIFLLDQSGSQAAAFFAASTEADCLLAMQQALTERTAEAQRERRRLQEEIHQTEKDLEAFAPLPALAHHMKEAENLYAQIEAIGRAVPALEALILTADNLAQRLRLWTQNPGAFSTLRRPPTCRTPCPCKNVWISWKAPTDPSKEPVPSQLLLRPCTILHQSRTPRRSMNFSATCKGLIAASPRTQTSEVLGRVQEPPSLSNTTALARLAARLDETLWRLHVENQRKEAASALQAPSALRTVQELTQTLEALKARLHHLRTAAAQHQALEPLQAPPELRSLQDLQQKLDALQVFHRAVSTVEARAQRLKVLQSPPSLRDPNPLQQIIETMERLEDQRKTPAKWPSMKPIFISSRKPWTTSRLRRTRGATA
ncbi:MAG: hypothetical protein ACUVSA_14270 [Desulfosoma sp.]|uniref:hypothetical protein n=1 Tax=Desulfosoma sp. TaxID=2603217 RepID=UPI00404972D3